MCIRQAAMQIPHGLVVDDCQQALYVADRERTAVHRFKFAALRQPPATSDADPAGAAADTKTRLRARLQRRLLLDGVSAQSVDSLAATAGGRRQQRSLLQEADAAAEIVADAGAAETDGSADAAADSTAGAGNDSGAGSGADGHADAGGDADASSGKARISSFSGTVGAAALDSADSPDMTLDLQEFGPVYGLTAGPYGSLLALCWDRGANRVWLLLLDFTSGALQCHLKESPHICSSHFAVKTSMCFP